MHRAVDVTFQRPGIDLGDRRTERAVVVDLRITRQQFGGVQQKAPTSRRSGSSWVTPCDPAPAARQDHAAPAALQRVVVSVVPACSANASPLRAIDALNAARKRFSTAVARA